MSKVIMALDQGTTSSRTILFNEAGEILASNSMEFQCQFPQSGWVEQHPEDIWTTQQITMVRALSEAKLTMKDVAGIGITNQRETIVAWNKETGEAIGKAIVWQCRRTTDICENLKKEGFGDVIRQKTGLVIDPYFSGTKMHWILKENEEAKSLARQGKLALGTVDSWLIWKLTGGEAFVTDASNASRTLVYNIFEQTWDQEILAHLDIPSDALPEVKGSSEVVGYTNLRLFDSSVPIAGIAGDQQASLFGQACFEKGMVKNTYGTGCFMLANLGNEGLISSHGLLTTIAWKINNEITYTLEGSIFIAGALIQWLRDGLKLFEHADVTEAMAQSVDDSGGVYIVPAFVGLGAPYWDPYARGTIIGLTRGTTREHIVRAGLEAIAYQAYDIFNCLQKDMGQSLPMLKVDGGATANNFLCQFQADILGVDISRPEILETTAMGAAFLAGLAVGVWPDQNALRTIRKEQRRFSPQLPAEQISVMVQGWEKAVNASKNWAKD